MQGLKMWGWLRNRGRRSQSDASISYFADYFCAGLAWSGAWVVASQLGVAATPGCFR